MRYPNRRYGNPTAMAYYAVWYGTTADLAKALKRSERTVKDWLSGATKVPWWVPEIMRLQRMEHEDIAFQITGKKAATGFGVVAPSGVLIDAGLRFKPDPWAYLDNIFKDPHGLFQTADIEPARKVAGG